MPSSVLSNQETELESNAMPQGLYLSQKMALAQVLAPQLQQSLALLQAPTMELQALVQQEMEQNPVLEEVPDTDLQQEKPERVDAEGDSPAASADLAEPPADTQFDPATEKPNSEPVDEFQAEFEKLQQLDQDWRDNFAATNAPIRSTQEDEEKRDFMFNSLVSQTSLQENLLGQVRLSELNNGQVSIAELIIGNIDDYGYLKAGVDELSLSTNVEPEKIESVLQVIQNFHPPGVGARDLRECLLLQLERKKQKHTLEYKIIDQCFDALSKRRIPEIARVLDRDIDDIRTRCNGLRCWNRVPVGVLADTTYCVRNSRSRNKANLSEEQTLPLALDPSDSLPESCQSTYCKIAKIYNLHQNVN